jgi:hypothetical protein
LTQDGTNKLITNALKAKEEASQWRDVALILAEAIAALDFRDVDDVLPYSAAQEIEDCIKKGEINKLCQILNIG